MKSIYSIAMVLLIIGGINWGLIGLFGLDLVAVIFGDMSALSRLIYSLVGVSSVIVLASMMKSK